MTLAICAKCGGQKLGAWTGCPDCSFRPTTEDEMVLAMALSERCLGVPHLTMLAAKIEAGQDAATLLPDLSTLRAQLQEANAHQLVAQLVTGQGAAAPTRPKLDWQNIFGHALLVPLAPFIVVFSLAICISILAKGRIPIIMRPWWPWLANRFSSQEGRLH